MSISTATYEATYAQNWQATDLALSFGEMGYIWVSTRFDTEDLTRRAINEIIGSATDAVSAALDDILTDPV